MLYYVFSGPLSLRAYVPEIKFNNNNIINSSVPFLAMLSCRRHKHQHDKYEY